MLLIDFFKNNTKSNTLFKICFVINNTIYEIGYKGYNSGNRPFWSCFLYYYP